MMYLRLFFEFFKVGLFAVGGGMATFPFLSALADKTGWYTQGQLADMVAISESTPGPIGVNMATYVGFTTRGIPGALVATVGHGMSFRPGVSAKLFTALAEAGVNIRMIDQGSSEMNIIVGVENKDFETAIRAIYQAFVEA